MITNINFLGYYGMRVNRRIVTNLVNEAVQIIDTKKRKMEHAMIKHKSKINFINLKARNTFSNK